MSKINLLFHTLKYLKFEQVYYRVRRKLFKPRTNDLYYGITPTRSKCWKICLLYHEKITQNLSSKFLNYKKNLKLPKDWNDEKPNKLWVYNLHYFEDLLASGAKEKKKFHIELIDLWIAQNPVGFGNGWEPYPTSLRIVNILKAWLSGLELEERHFKSLYEQASYLSNDLEKHLLGNHYFVNLKALLFAGIIFGNGRWLQIATEGLMKQIPEQILNDGANFELTPMYHALILVDMLDMYNLSLSYQEQFPEQLRTIIVNKIPKMIDFLEDMSHSDEKISFFNDSAFGIAPDNFKIFEYAEILGFNRHKIENASNELKVIDHRNSGYVSVKKHGFSLIADLSPIGPDYIPGHAHADTLSFEMSIKNQRIFVNSGTSEYGTGPERLRQRGTKAHNTVSVNGLNSSEVWSGFRVARRARVFDRIVDIDKKQFSAAHDGFKQQGVNCIHRRVWCINDNELIIKDFIEGDWCQAEGYLHLHPDVEVEALHTNEFRLHAQGLDVFAHFNNCSVTIKPSSWHPEFGFSIPTKKLVYSFNKNLVEIKIHY